MSIFKLTKIIEKKRNGESLSEEDIGYFVDCVSAMAKTNVKSFEAVDRSQIGSMLMAMYFQGLNCNETILLTENMKNSGYVFSWPDEWRHLVVDKHSTGGVGDKVSLILAPTLAALGLKNPMISGRSLSHTGGTLDKLESIPGFKVNLSKEEIYNIIQSVGCCIVGQTDDCVPADKVLYHCREITATVSSPPLIIASIVSKKLSENTNVLVYDVKYGKGSIFKTKEEAIDAAKKLVETSKGTKASAVLTSMENPLGRTIGNALEVLEALECLKMKGPSDVLEVTYALGCEILRLLQNTSKQEGEALISEVLKSGRALEKFHDMIIHQGVSKEVAKQICYRDATSVLPQAPYASDIYYSGEGGYICEIDPLILANIWKEEDTFSNNSGVGLRILKGVGDRINPGEAWLTVHHHRTNMSAETQNKLKKAIQVAPEMNEKSLIDRRIFYSEKLLLTEEKF